jgi:predicted enzyme related to lactoylglutathione lyase
MNRVIHFEIHAENLQRAGHFYGELFNWKFEKYMPEEYWLITTGPDGEPGINGGLFKRRGIPGVGWVAYCKDTEGNIFGMMQNDPSAK